MSIRVMSQVWQDAPVGGGRLLVLLALADFSDDGGMSWPSVTTLAAKARLSERHTQRALNDLEAIGWVTRQINGGPFGATRYWITLPVGGDKMSGVTS